MYDASPRISGVEMLRTKPPILISRSQNVCHLRWRGGNWGPKAPYTKCSLDQLGSPEPGLIPITWLHVHPLLNPECVNTSLNNVTKVCGWKPSLLTDGWNKQNCDVSATSLPKMANWRPLRVFLHHTTSICEYAHNFLICDWIVYLLVSVLQNVSWSLDDMPYGGNGPFGCKIKAYWNQYWVSEDWLSSFLKLLSGWKRYQIGTFWHKCLMQIPEYAILPPPNFGVFGTKPSMWISGPPFRHLSETLYKSPVIWMGSLLPALKCLVSMSRVLLLYFWWHHMAVVGHLWNYIGYLRLQSGYTPQWFNVIFHGLAYIKIIVALTVAALILLSIVISPVGQYLCAYYSCFQHSILTPQNHSGKLCLLIPTSGKISGYLLHLAKI